MTAAIDERTGQLLAGLEQSANGAHALPVGCYNDPDFFALEVERVLRPGWHAVARFDSLPEPGDYASITLCGEPLLLVRDREKKLRVYSRVCSHRAHILVEGTGNTGRFVCPYHLWSYGLDGELKTAPLMQGRGDGSEDFDPERCSLPELRTVEWQGFVLATLDPASPSPVAALAPLAERLVPYGFAELVTAGLLEFDSPWNWKVMVDNFMESYHHMGPHADTLQPTYHAADTFTADLEGPFSLLENPAVDGSPDLYVAMVFPTLLLAVFDGQPVGSWYEMQIDRHDHFHLRVHALASPELAATEGAPAMLLESFREVHLQDIAACEGVQRGLESRIWRPGPLSVLERCLTEFHQHLAKQLRCEPGA